MAAEHGWEGWQELGRGCVCVYACTCMNFSKGTGS